MLVDAHAHLDRYGERVTQAIQQINEQRILTISVSMNIDSYLRARKIAELSAYIKPTFGIHPWEAPQYATILDQLDPYLKGSPLIGEIGLDHYFVKDKGLFPSQWAVFEYQCDWAARLGKIINLHTKGAEPEVLEIITRKNIVSSIVHWYSGPTNLITSYIDAGSYFTIGVEILSSRRIEKIADLLPLDRILLETDNPGGYEWLTGSTGMPIVIREVLGKLAEVKQTDTQTLENQICGNWQRLTQWNSPDSVDTLICSRDPFQGGVWILPCS